MWKWYEKCCECLWKCLCYGIYSSKGHFPLVSVYRIKVLWIIHELCSSPHFPIVWHADSISENLSDYENGPYALPDNVTPAMCAGSLGLVWIRDIYTTNIELIFMDLTSGYISTWIRTFLLPKVTVTSFLKVDLYIIQSICIFQVYMPQ